MTENDNENYDPRTAKKLKRSTGPYGISTIYRSKDNAYMTRIWLGRLRLHIFHCGDEDQDPHDHPWSFITFPFQSYVEEVTEACAADTLANALMTPTGTPIEMQYRKRLQVVPAWRFNKRPAEHCHRVLGLYTGYIKDPFGMLVRYPATRAAKVNSKTFVPQWEPLDGKHLFTIVWRSGFTRTWGFLKNRDGKWCWIAFKDYIQSGGSPGPCE